MSYVAVIGETVADAFIEPGRAPGGGLTLTVRAGGGPANTAVALGRLGTPTRFVGRLAGGAIGGLIRDHLIESTVDLSSSVVAAEPPTLAVTAVDDSGKAAYDFYASQTADWQWSREELDALSLDDAACVHTGSLGLALPPGGPLVEELLGRKREGATISIDPNVRPQLVSLDSYRKGLRRWTAFADLVRLSDEDLDHLYPGAALVDLADEWHGRGVELVIVTVGSKGAVASLRGERIDVPAAKVEVVDTVGAGDAFTAGLLDALFRAGRLGGRLDALTIDEVRQAVAFGIDIAGRTCAVPGANPPWRRDLDS